MLFSVVICTYNRADWLALALESACRQTLPAENYEVIVVDNHSSDHTRAVVERFQQQYPQVRYCLEPELGISPARNRGMQESGAEYVAYFDDDCKAPEQWLEIARDIVRQVSPDIFGGPHLAMYNSPVPAWFKDDYGSWKPGDSPRIVPPSNHLIALNMFVRRDFLRQLGGFSKEFGYIGTKIAYGEETELLERARKMAPDILVYYHPDLYVYHLVRAEKMRLGQVIKHRFAMGRYSYLAFSGGKHTFELRHVLGLLAMPFVIILDASLIVLLRDRKKYPYMQNYIYEHTCQDIALWGKLFERLCRTLGAKK